MAVPENDLVTSFNRTVKSYAEEHQFGRPSDVLIINKTGDARLCYYC